MFLYEISGRDKPTQDVIGQLRKYCPMLNYLHFFAQDGSSAHERFTDDIDGTFDTRSVATDFDSQEFTPVWGDFVLKAYGKLVTLDTIIEEQGFNVASEMAVKLMSWGENAGRSLQGMLLDDSTLANAEQTNGLKRLVTLATASDATRTLTAGGDNGLQVITGNDNTARKSQQALVEALKNLIANVGGANCLLMDFALLSRLSTIASDICTISLNEFGVQIGQFLGVPIVPLWTKFNGTPILPFTETVGTSTDCGSVYAFRSDTKSHLTAMTTKVGLKVYPMQLVTEKYQHLIQFQMGLGTLSSKCIGRLQGVRLG